MDKVKVVVVFRKYPKGDILAVFPEIPADHWGKECMAYANLGQHGSADAEHVTRATKPAKPSEYKDLKRELESIGYIVDVRQKITAAMNKKRTQQATASRK